MTMLFNTLLGRHITAHEWGRKPLQNPDGKWVYIQAKSRLEVRETIFTDDADERKTMQHLELRSVTPVRWEQWIEVYHLWIGDWLSAKGEESLSRRRVVDDKGALLYHALNAWYVYPDFVIQDYIAKKDHVSTAR